MAVHLPVMVREVLEMLQIRQGGVYVDATVGLGGHAQEILGLMGPEGKVVGIDRDEAALMAARERLADERVVLVKGKFSELREILTGTGMPEVDGVLFDFGVS